MVQPIDTALYGKLYFEKIFSGTSQRVNNVPVALGGSIGILTNGSWVHFPSGHPIAAIEDGRRILREVNPLWIKDFEDWFEHRDELAELEAGTAARPIQICADEILRFSDGDQEEVTMVSDVYGYFKPGTMALEIALRLFTTRQQQREKEKAEAILGKNRQDPTSIDEAFGRMRTGGRPAPVTAEEAKENARQEQRMAALEKAREARARKMAEKKRQQEEEKVNA